MELKFYLLLLWQHNPILMSDNCSVTPGSVKRIWLMPSEEFKAQADNISHNSDFADSIAYAIHNSERPYFSIDCAGGMVGSAYSHEVLFTVMDEQAEIPYKVWLSLLSSGIKQPQPGKLFRFLQSIFNYK